MITREEAERIAAEVVGASRDDADQGWELVEFDAGWLIQATRRPGDIAWGAVARVVERADGQVRRFPSSIPPQRILSQYDKVISRGRLEGRTSPRDITDGHQ
jgi:hypothetical protein